MNLRFLMFLFLGINAVSLTAQESVPAIDYDGEKKIQLAGSWQFHWNSLYHLDLSKEQPTLLVDVPSLWTQNDAETYPSFGYATYIVNVRCEEDYDQVSFILSEFFTSYNLFLNGKKVASNGVVGKTDASSQFEWKPQVVDVSLQEGTNEIAVEIANFQHSKGGFYRAITLGDREYLQKRWQEQLFMDSFTSGAYLMIGLFFLGMYLFWKRSTQILYYVLFVISYCFRILTTGHHIFYKIFDSLHWHVSVQIEYLSFYGCMISSWLFFARMVPKKIYWGVVAINLIFCLCVLVLPLHVYSQIMSPSLLFESMAYLILLYYFFTSKVEDKKAFTMTIMFFSLASLSWLMDYLVYSDLAGLGIYAPTIVRAISILFFAFLVSREFTWEYNLVNNLQRQTEEQKKQLEERNHEVEILFREVNHRVKNNLQLIAGLLDIDRGWNQQSSAEKVLEDSRSRVEAIGLIHENLYQNEALSHIDIEKYVRQLVGQIGMIYEGSTDVRLAYHIEKHEFNPDTAIAVGLIVNELVTNAYKYSLKDGKGAIHVGLHRTALNEFELKVEDAGEPMSKSCEELVKTGFGLRLASRLARQIRGTLSHEYVEGNIFNVVFEYQPEDK